MKSTCRSVFISSFVAVGIFVSIACRASAAPMAIDSAHNTREKAGAMEQAQNALKNAGFTSDAGSEEYIAYAANKDYNAIIYLVRNDLFVMAVSGPSHDERWRLCQLLKSKLE